MYARSLTCFRLIRNLSSTQISRLSYRELASDRHSVSSCLVYTYQDLLDRKKSITCCCRKYSSDTKESKQAPPEKVNIKKSPQVDIVNEVKKLLTEVKFSELSSAPQAAFWLGVGSLLPFVLVPVSSIIFGYSSFLTSAELAYGATMCAYLGGMKWGYTLEEKSPHKPSWENLSYAIIPQGMGWLALMLPQTLGFLVISCGLLGSTFIDLTQAQYPSWFKAMRLCFTPIAVIFLLFAALMRLVH